MCIRVWLSFYTVESLDKMVDQFNTLIVECLDRHAHLTRLKTTCPLRRGDMHLISDTCKLREISSACTGGAEYE